MSTAFPIGQNRAVLEGASADSALAELGLRRSQLVRAVARAEVDKQSCTALDPPSMPGLMRWGRGTRYLREQLIPEGWASNDSDNYPRTVSPGGDVAIVVAGGDAATGDPRYTPRTRYPKGPLTHLAVEGNRQLALFGTVAALVGAPTQTWILLISESQDSILKAELSCPASITDQGWIDSWSMRIILGDIAPIPAPLDSSTEPPSTPPIDVPVVRKTGRS